MKLSLQLILIMVSTCIIGSCVNRGVSLSVENPLDIARHNEIISVERELLESHLNCEHPIEVSNEQQSQTLVTQLVDLDQDGNWETLLIELSIDASSRQDIHLKNVPSLDSSQAPKVFGRFVPERKDDFAWENDRIAFRMYGPALEASGEISSGVDVWVKSVDYPIIDKWYAQNKYHKDHGEGADLYKVGPTLGAGGLGLLVDDSLYTSQNFTDYRILADGPLRFVFELDYAEWGHDSLRIIETKRIRLDAGEHFNLIQSQLKMSVPLPFGSNIVTGLLAHPISEADPVSINGSENYLVMYEPIKGENGSLGTAVVRKTLMDNTSLKKMGNQYLMVLPIDPTGVVQYVAGAGWSKSPWLGSEADWQALVESYGLRQKHPLKLEFKN